MFEFLWSLISHDIGIDLGTANTMVHVKNKGIVIREPSVVAQHKKSKQILAIGTEAKRMLGKTPSSIVAVRPLSDGVISDFDITEQMLRYFIRKVHQTRSLLPKIPRPRVVIGVPSGVTEVERKAVIDAAMRAGAREVFLIEEPMAAAIGAGLPVEEPTGNMVVDIGGGTTEIAVISLSGIVVNRSIRTAGNEMDQDIVYYARAQHNLLLGERTAEDIKIELGSAYLTDEEFEKKTMTMRGRDLVSGLPKAVEVATAEIREAISGTISQIVESIKDTIEETPPELLADIMKNGIIFAGGGSLIRGINILVSEKTGMPVKISDDPLTCVVRGTGKVLEEIELLQKVKLAGRKETF
ncbi:rod shape-determining protein [candidate division WWE3 bacterium CG06_land_8_20_14_3_00_42_16]|uniref:Cell shape-determining protein MreB n=5 Tax=Katanobacteria TaxID=422282 RepID=A0A2M7APM7_UNCKA|nr:MAG: rod shape-determining protein [candidate division WWE3 bacterium CG06_land_8_20_14_3_00_42_16]PIZ42851.1 MAG: rod shape-determining protein [candidate division WWE3 bacterium CG_4_10_14_0_2_um_filter_42_8]PJC69075.1 MAG: rod shape-determining protein [candidate division WWE3 bacterium CG_4_8_14_3_um_filter_42_11]